MPLDLQELKTLKKDCYIQNICYGTVYYYKVLKAEGKGLILSESFQKGSESKGSWYLDFKKKTAEKDWIYWYVIKACSKEAKNIEKKLD